MPDPTRRAWSPSDPADSPALSGSAFLLGFSGWLEQDSIPSLRRRVAELERCAAPARRSDALRAVVDRLRETIGHLERLVVALRHHAGPDPEWSAVQRLAEQAVESCRTARARRRGDAAAGRRGARRAPGRRRGGPVTGTEGQGPLERELDHDGRDPEVDGYDALFLLAGRLRDLDQDTARLADDLHPDRAGTALDDQER